jgi:hypothetical protein
MHPCVPVGGLTYVMGTPSWSNDDANVWRI